MNKLVFKAVISSILVLAVLFLAVSGALLFFGKAGMVWGIARSVLRSIHFWVAVSMCLLTVVHFALNRKQYQAGLRRLVGRGNRNDE